MNTAIEGGKLKSGNPTPAPIPAFEIKTPDLVFTRNTLKEVLVGVKTRTMDIKQANTLVSAVGQLHRAVSTDLRVRLSQPKLIEIESKTISQTT